MTELRGFTVRAYGLLESNGKLLATRELIGGKEYLKFPGGGVELGEGTNEALVREFDEELGLAITVSDHVYTTDHFVQSAFKPEYQVIAVYYLVHTTTPETMKIKDKDIPGVEWLEKKMKSVEKLSFDLDKKAMELFVNM